MPRIAESELERLKQTISLQRLTEARGMELKRHGADLIGRCPFHDDKTARIELAICSSASLNSSSGVLASSD